MGLSAPYVGIHGTPDAASIGYSASHGCIRMLIPQVEWLFTQVDWVRRSSSSPRDRAHEDSSVRSSRSRPSSRLLGAARLEGRSRTIAARPARSPRASIPPRRRSRSSRLDGSGGDSRSLDLAKGRPVVVNFWASWCVPCKDEAPALQATYEQYRKQGLVVVGIDVEDFKQDAKRFAKRYGLTYPIVYDGNRSTIGKWGVTGYPETFFVDRRGPSRRRAHPGRRSTRSATRSVTPRASRLALGTAAVSRASLRGRRSLALALARAGGARGGQPGPGRSRGARSSARPARRRSTSRTRRSRRG